MPRRCFHGDEAPRQPHDGECILCRRERQGRYYHSEKGQARRLRHREKAAAQKRNRYDTDFEFRASENLRSRRVHALSRLDELRARRDG